MRSHCAVRPDSRTAPAPDVRRAALLVAVVGFLVVGAAVAQGSGPAARGAAAAGRVAGLPQDQVVAATGQTGPSSIPRGLAPDPAAPFALAGGASATAAASPSPTQATTLFSLPNKDALGYGPDALADDAMRGFGVAADGSLWIGNYKDQAVTLAHVSAAGAPIDIDRMDPLDDQMQPGVWERIYDVQVRGNDPWLLMGRPAQASIARLDGLNSALPTLARYPLPQRIDDLDVGDLLINQALAFSFGPSGEVLLSWDSPDGRVAVLVDATGQATPFHTDADGKTAIASQTYYPGAGPETGRTYKAYLAGAPGTSPVGFVAAGSTTVRMTADSPLAGVHLFNVAGDGSFYVLADQTGGNPRVRYATVFHYTGNGRLLGAAQIPGIGTYAATMRRLAQDQGGSLYALVPQADGVAIQRLVLSPASSAPATPVLPTPRVTPTLPPYVRIPTPTATPASLDVLAQRSTLIVEAEVVPGDLDRARTHQSIRVLQWLGPARGGTEFLNVEEAPAENDRISLGSGHFVFFLEPNQRVYWCQGTEDFYQITGGLQGIYEIRGGVIAWAGLRQYEGWSVARLEAALRALPPTPAPPGDAQAGQETPSGTPADPLADLARFVNSADMIAEVDNPYSGAATGTVIYHFRVREWLKRPPGSFGNDIGFDTHCAAGRISRGSGHYIVFVVQGDPAASGWLRDSYLAGGSAGVYSILGGVVEMGRMNYFQGWPLDRFEAAIRAALAAPGAADPALRKPYPEDPTGKG